VDHIFGVGHGGNGLVVDGEAELDALVVKLLRLVTRVDCAQPCIRQAHPFQEERAGPNERVCVYSIAS
jgi:hypothetical protein